MIQMKGKIGKWMDNARKVALPQSMMPALLAVVVAYASDGDFVWWAALLAVIGVASAHLGLNIADDYFDYKVDMLGDRDKVVRQGFRAMTAKYPYLTSGEETLKTTAAAIAHFAAFAIGCGAAIFAMRTLKAGLAGPEGSWWIPAIAVACAFLGMFYSAPPLKLAYRGLGELVIGVIFGPLLMMGVYYATCGKMDMTIVYASIPTGLLVLNILFTHSFIDIHGDAASNKMTFARLLGSNAANLAASALFIFGPFVLVIVAVCLGQFHPAYLASLVALPRGIWLYRSLVLFLKGELMDIEKPHKWLGPMPDWKKIHEAHIDWFMVRWLTARNLLTQFCLSMMVVSLVLALVK